LTFPLEDCSEFGNFVIILIYLPVKSILSDGIPQAFLPLRFVAVNFISLPQEVRGIFVNKAAVEMQNILPFCD
jgi:hypothetical protein